MLKSKERSGDIRSDQVLQCGLRCKPSLIAGTGKHEPGCPAGQHEVATDSRVRAQGDTLTDLDKHLRYRSKEPSC